MKDERNIDQVLDEWDNCLNEARSLNLKPSYSIAEISDLFVESTIRTIYDLLPITGASQTGGGKRNITRARGEVKREIGHRKFDILFELKMGALGLLEINAIVEINDDWGNTSSKEFLWSDQPLGRFAKSVAKYIMNANI